MMHRAYGRRLLRKCRCKQDFKPTQISLRIFVYFIFFADFVVFGMMYDTRPLRWHPIGDAYIEGLIEL
jgi:hypothetical protein